MDSEAARRARAEARQKTAILHRTTLQRDEADLSVSGAEALSLVTQLTRGSWAMSGRSIPTYTRDSIPCRFVPNKRAAGREQDLADVKALERRKSGSQ